MRARAQLIKEWSYVELFELITIELVGVRTKHQTRSKHQQTLKVWWHEEVQQVIKERQKALGARRESKNEDRRRGSLIENGRLPRRQSDNSTTRSSNGTKGEDGDTLENSKRSAMLMWKAYPNHIIISSSGSNHSLGTSVYEK